MVRAGGSVPFGIIGACLVAAAWVVLGDACSPYGEGEAGDEPEAGGSIDGAAKPPATDGGCTGAKCSCVRDEDCIDPAFARCIAGQCAKAAGTSDAAAPSSDASSCAACPPGTARMLCVDDACVSTRRVFVSSQASTAHLGGHQGADERCATIASAAQLGGNWRAWVSGAGTSPSDRFEKSPYPYRLLDGTMIATSWTDLTDGSLLHGIDRDETGALVLPVEVWTGTRPDGVPVDGVGCFGFTTSSESAPTVQVGLSGRLGNDWTTAYAQYCNRTDPRIYCFEQ
jgi:hypothetical protein